MIKDTSSVSNHGMFSKYGRFTSEKYPIILKKDDILSGERKTFKVKRFGDLYEDKEEREYINPTLVQKNLKELIKKKQEAEEKLKNNRKSAGYDFSKCLNREDHFLYKTMEGKEVPCPTKYKPKQANK